MAAIATAAAMLSAGSALGAPVETAGFLKFEYWTGMESGTSVDLLTGYPEYPANPSIVSYIAGFNTRSVFPNDSHEQYGARVSGFITPTESGDYRFFIHSDDASQLWLSIDATEANLQMIAEEPGCCNAYTEPEEGTTRTSEPISLVAGQKYFIQGLYKEGGGGDYMDVAWRKEGDTTPAAQLRPLSGSILSALAEPEGASVTFTTQPQSQAVTENSLVTFSAVASTTTDYLMYPGGSIAPAYQWYRNDAAIPGANSASYTTAPVKIATDNNAKYKVVVSVPGLSQTSAEATLTITQDTTAPEIASVDGSALFTSVTVTFNEPIDPATAGTAGNYSLTPSLNITEATVTGLNTVVLTTAAQTPSTSYTLQVNGVKDVAGNTIAANSTATFSSFINATGALQFAFWEGITTTAVQALLDDPRYPANPDGIMNLTSFNTRSAFPDDSHENYGATITALLTPTETADYRFFIHSDDSSQLWLSTDATEANLQMIAEETGCCNAYTEPDQGTTRTSEPINLVAGQKYLIRGIYKEGGGGDYMDVAWRKEGDATPAAALQPIPGRFFEAPVHPEGILVSTFPAPNTLGAAPDDPIQVVHINGSRIWDQSNVTLKVDDVSVTPTVTKEGSVATVSYTPSPVFQQKTTHKATFTYLNAAGETITNEWSFTIAPITLDKVQSRIGLIKGTADFTADGDGHTGAAGDYAIDLGMGGGQQSVLIKDGTFLNAATADDTLTFSIWVKLHEVADSSAFWADSTTSPSSRRGFQAHTPWSNNRIYFDTGGCCAFGETRLDEDISILPSYAEVGDQTWWTSEWRHFAFVKDGAIKRIYVDGELFIEGDGTTPLPTDFERIWLGAEGGGPAAGTANNMRGLMDDFAAFGVALTETQIDQIVDGTLPTALPANTELLAYFDFNDAGTVEPGDGPALSVERSGAGLTISWPADATGFRLQSSSTVTGPYADVAGVTGNSHTIASPAGTTFYILTK